MEARLKRSSRGWAGFKRSSSGSHEAGPRETRRSGTGAWCSGARGVDTRPDAAAQASWIGRGLMLFRLLGPLEVDVGNGPVPLGGPKQRAVLAHLVLRANQLVSAETLIDDIWGEEPPERARNVIQTYVSHLRKALGPDRIQSHGPGYRLRLDLSELDASRFAVLMRDGKKALPVDPNVAVATLEDALALWRGGGA